MDQPHEIDFKDIQMYIYIIYLESTVEQAIFGVTSLARDTTCCIEK